MSDRSHSRSRSRSASPAPARDRSKSKSRSRSKSPKRGSRSPSPARARSRSRSRDRGRSRRRSRRSPSRSRSRDRGRRGRRRSRSRSRSRSRRGYSPPRRGGRGGYEEEDPTFGKKVYIGDLSYDTRVEDLRRTCEKFGEVVDVFMPRGQDGGTRGFGFVTFSSKAEAEDASRDLDGSDVDGRRVKANIARARPPRPGDRGRGPDRGSSRGGGRSTTKLYVGNLPMDTTEEDLAKTFDKFGKISLLELKRVQKPPMFAFIEYEDERDAADAVKDTDQSEFRGAHLRVEFANNSR